MGKPWESEGNLVFVSPILHLFFNYISQSLIFKSISSEATHWLHPSASASLWLLTGLSGLPTHGSPGSPATLQRPSP